MTSMFIPTLLFYYGAFLILCGIASVMLIGMKAKTALISGGLSGVIAITTGHFISLGSEVAEVTGLLVCLMLFGVFCWRSEKTLFTILELIPQNHPDLKSKTIAFLIISLMAVVTLMVLLIQLVAMSMIPTGVCI